MDIDKCRALLKAVDCGSLSAAAAEMGYTPAGIWYMVEGVERELGFPVLKRGPSGVELSANGREILPSLRELVRLSDRITQQAYELNNLFSGEVSVAAFSSIASRLMPRVITAFQRDYPHVSIRIIEGIQEELVDLLIRKKVEFILCGYQEIEGFQWIFLRDDPMLAVLPRKHLLAVQAAIRPEQLRGQPLVMPGNGRDPHVLELLKKFSVEPYVKYATIETNSAFALVENGLGICIANELITDRVKDAVILPFDPPQYMSEGILLPVSGSLSPAAGMLVKYIRELLTEQPCAPI